MKLIMPKFNIDLFVDHCGKPVEYVLEGVTVFDRGDSLTFSKAGEVLMVMKQRIITLRQTETTWED